MDTKNSETDISEAIEQKERADRFLLLLEIVIGIISILFFFSMIFIAAFVEMADWIRESIIFLGFVPLLIGTGFAIKIEQVAGYYECQVCGHRYVPTYFSVLFAPHINRTRYMKCPHCSKKSWQKKVISKK